MTVAPSDGSQPVEVFFVLTDQPGEVYTLVVGSDTSAGKFEGIAGKFEGIVLYAFDSKGARIETTVVTGAEAGSPHPGAFALYQNYPNPFNPTTTIRYDVPIPTALNLSIYDVTGRKVRTLADEKHAAGSYSIEWDGLSSTGARMASGLYLFRLVTETYGESRTMMLVK